MVRKYFAAANTSDGYVNMIENNLADCEKIYVISGASKKEKTEIMLDVLKKAEGKFERIECMVNPFDISDMDAVKLGDIKTAVVDEDVYNTEKTSYKLRLNKELSPKAQEISDKSAWAFGQLYNAYASAKVIHDEWEKLYAHNMDFKRLEAYEEGILSELLNKHNNNKGTQNYHRFFGSSTPDGSVNYIDNLTENLSSRYFIKGRPGTGKSTFLKKLAKKANELGFDAEIYYCSFDKKSLDMVIVPKLSFCVFDSTAPHEMFPKDSRDKILDFYEESGLCGTDEKFEKEFSDVAVRYNQKVAEGMAFLRLGKLYLREQEYLLSKNKDQNKIDTLKSKLIQEILGT